MNRTENVRVQDGVLALVAQRESLPFPCTSADKRFPQGREYTSGFVSTKGKVDWSYGRVEVRAKLPTQPGTSRGLWPAAWMRPTDLGKGELDIFEALGSGSSAEEANKIHQTIHYDYEGTHPLETHIVEFPSPVPSDGFHEYTVEWEHDAIRWYIDDRLTFIRDTSTTPWFSEAFTRPFFLRLNLAVGGWPGDADISAAFPAQFLVDSVKVFQRG